MEVKLQVFCSNSFYELISWVFLGKMLSAECLRTPLMTSQHRFRLWLGAVRQQAITWANFDPDLHCHSYDIVRKQFTFFFLINHRQYTTFVLTNHFGSNVRRHITTYSISILRRSTNVENVPHSYSKNTFFRAHLVCSSSVSTSPNTPGE